MISTPLRSLTLLAGALAFGTVIGCGGEKDDTGGETGDTSDTGDTGETGETGETGDTGETGETGADTYSVAGTAVDFAGQMPAAEGLCVIAVDPGPAITGGVPTVLATSTVGAGGSFTVAGIAEKPALGLVIIVQDCAMEGTVYPTGTGIASSTLAGIAAGGTLSDMTAFSINATMRDGMVASFTAAGGSWDPATAGVLMGFVFDTAGTPIGDATVTGAGSTTYYLDPDTSDGLFTTAGVGVNAATNPSALSCFAIPAAPITTYTATAAGYSFDTITGGSLPGLALFIAFYGEAG